MVVDDCFSVKDTTEQELKQVDEAGRQMQTNANKSRDEKSLEERAGQYVFRGPSVPLSLLESLRNYVHTYVGYVRACGRACAACSIWILSGMNEMQMAQMGNELRVTLQCPGGPPGIHYIHCPGTR